MEIVKLQDVFKDTGVPLYTFVQPKEYTKTKVSVGTHGKGLIIEGPSGIGKTTSIKRIIDELGMNVTQLSARKKDDIELIELLLHDNRDMGIIIIDDFHMLSIDRREALAHLLKTIADENREDIKLILIGINKAGDALVKLAPDLNNRIDTITFESNPIEKVKELIEKGEKILNITFKDKDKIAQRAHGSFHITQLLCKELCIMQEIVETQEKLTTISVSVSDACDNKTRELSRVFEPVVRSFSVGNKIRRGGRAPYFHLLMWLSESKDWSIQMDSIYVRYPIFKQSISQVAEKGYLSDLIAKNEDICKYLHYDNDAKILTIEDPKFMFYLRNLNWDTMARDIGFTNIHFANKYDFALSFAGEIRSFPQRLSEILVSEYDYNVFYDMDARAEILGRNLEEYFYPIYNSEAEYVIVFLDNHYANKVWTVFESKSYKERFAHDAVIPIVSRDFKISPTDILFNKGYLPIDFNSDIDKQVRELATLLDEKFKSKRAAQTRQE